MSARNFLIDFAGMYLNLAVGESFQKQKIFLKIPLVVTNLFLQKVSF